MYLRVATLIELAAEVIDISSRQTLAQRLGIALPTLNAYRGGQRFPESGDESLLRKRIQALLCDAIQQVDPGCAFDCEAYILSTLRLGKSFRRLNKTFGVQGMGHIASRIVVELFSGCEAREYPASTALTHLIRQEPSRDALCSIIGWVFTKFVKSIDAFDGEPSQARSKHAPFPVVVENLPDFVNSFNEKENVGVELHIPMPWASDIILLAADGFGYSIEMSKAPEDEGRLVTAQFEVRYMNKHVLKPPQRTISWHRR